MPWAALLATAWACAIAVVQWRWGGFDYVPTVVRMGAFERPHGLLVSGWLWGSGWHAAFGILGFGLAFVQMERRAGSLLATFLYAPVESAWSLRGVGDVSGDGTDDIIWRHSNGLVHCWPIENGTKAGRVNIGSPVASNWSLRGVGSVA